MRPPFAIPPDTGERIFILQTGRQPSFRCVRAPDCFGHATISRGGPLRTHGRMTSKNLLVDPIFNQSVPDTLPPDTSHSNRVVTCEECQRGRVWGRPQTQEGPESCSLILTRGRSSFGCRPALIGLSADEASPGSVQPRAGAESPKRRQRLRQRPIALTALPPSRAAGLLGSAEVRLTSCETTRPLALSRPRSVCCDSRHHRGDFFSSPRSAAISLTC
jgi:hypothetical protein